MSSDTSNMADIIDSRDIIERLEELNDVMAQLPEDPSEEDLSTADIDIDEYEEWKRLKALAEECEGLTSEWKDGATLIRYSYWTDHVQSECEELGYISRDFPWWIEIDWERTASNVAQDYSTVDYDGIEYYIRNS